LVHPNKDFVIYSHSSYSTSFYCSVEHERRYFEDGGNQWSMSMVPFFHTMEVNGACACV